jgi:hypothetical protein
LGILFDLGQDGQRKALEYARAETGRPSHLLEKDLWVVWTVRALFESSLSLGRMPAGNIV